MSSQRETTLAPSGRRTLPRSFYLWACEGDVKFTVNTKENPFAEDETRSNPGNVSRTPVSFDSEGNASVKTARLLGDSITWKTLGEGAHRSTLESTEEALVLLTVLKRLSAFNPSSAGLIPARPGQAARREYNPYDSVLLPSQLTSSWWSSADIEEGCFSSLVGSIHPAWLEAGWGWFAPGANANEFGTPYLKPLGHLEGIDEYSYEPDQIPLSWGLCPVGVDEPIAVAEWNDEDGLAALVSHIFAYDAETTLTCYILNTQEGREAVQEAQKEYRYLVAMREAQADDRPRKKVRTGLAARAIKDALRASGLENSHYYRRNITLPGENLGSSKPNPLAIAITFMEEDISKDKFTRFLENLNASCEEKQIATLFSGKSTDRYEAYLVGDENFFNRYTPVFGVNENRSIKRYSSERS